MQNSATCIALLSSLSFLVAAHTTNGADFGDLYFVQQGSYARDRHYDQTRNEYPISTYLPHTTLVFRDRSAGSIKVPEGYTPVITQHGNRLFAESDSISLKPFRSLYGNLNYIFHQNAYMCAAINKTCTEATGIEIHRGQVVLGEFEGDSNFSDFVKLTRDEYYGNELIRGYGYIPIDRFEQYKLQGVVTDASQPFPKYIHEDSKIIASLSTECGETKKFIDTNKLAAEISTKIEPTGLIPWLKGVFSISAAASAGTEEQNIVETSYGDAGIAVKYWEILVSEPDKVSSFEDPLNRVFYVSVKLQCVSSGPEAQPIFIKSISIREGNLLKWWLQFDSFYDVSDEDLEALEPDSPQSVIYLNNKNRPFLTSINSPRDYDRAIRIWSGQVGDFSLASIFLSIFNASCPGEKVGGKVARETCYAALSIKEPEAR